MPTGFADIQLENFLSLPEHQILWGVQICFLDEAQWPGAQMFYSPISLGGLTCQNWQGVMVLWPSGEDDPEGYTFIALLGY